jgi:CRP/FNR family transcriptional regulator
MLSLIYVKNIKDRRRFILKKVIDFLSALDFFQGLKKEDLEDIANITVIKKFGGGELLFSEGDMGTGFYVVISGSIKVFKESPEGREVILHICGPRDQFGQVAVYAGWTFPASAQAMVSSRVLFFPREKFLELVTVKPHLALSMLSTLSLRIRQVTTQLESIALKEVPGRLAAYLLYVREEQGNSDRITLNIPRTELANFLGTTPETLSRILARLEEQGLIAVEKREISVKRPKELQILATEGKSRQ